MFIKLKAEQKQWPSKHLTIEKKTYELVIFYAFYTSWYINILFLGLLLLGFYDKQNTTQYSLQHDTKHRQLYTISLILNNNVSEQQKILKTIYYPYKNFSKKKLIFYFK